MFLDKIQEEVPQEPKRVDLKNFVGKRFSFTGFSDGPTLKDYYEDARSVIFILDGQKYQAVEDPQDGYRSSLSYVTETNEDCSNTFPTHIVKCEWKPDDYDTNETLQFRDVLTKKVVMEIGTDNADDYCPYFVGYFQPMDLAINANNKAYTIWSRKHKLKRILKDD